MNWTIRRCFTRLAVHAERLSPPEEIPELFLRLA